MKVSWVMKMCTSLKVTTLSVTRTIIIKQSHSRVFCYQAEPVSYSCSIQSTWSQERLGKGEGAKKCQKLKESEFEEDTKTPQHRIINSKRAH